MIRKRLMTEINLASLKSRDNYQSIFYSEDFQDILTGTLEHKYGGTYISNRAARIIQQAYRQYRLSQKLSSSPYYKTKTSHFRNNSMPDNLHFLKDDDGSHSSNECLNKSSNIFSPMRNLKSSKIKDSLSLLLPELQINVTTRSSLSDSSNTETDNANQEYKSFDNGQVKVGDILSNKCDEDLESFQNDYIKTDSAEESDSSSDIVSSSLRNAAGVGKLPPPMPVISTKILSNQLDNLKTKSKMFSFDKSRASVDSTTSEQENDTLKPYIPPRPGLSSTGSIQATRSPRDSGVSSHSSNTDLLTFEYPDSGKSHIINSLYSQRSPSVTSAGVSKSLITSNQYSAQREVCPENDSIHENYIPPISEDTDSLFDASAPLIPSVMTSSKDSGVDADSACGISNPPGHLRRLSFHDKPMYWKIFHRNSCFAGCVTQRSTASASQKIHSHSPSSPWLKHNIDEINKEKSENISDIEYKELINRVLYRVAVNLFNRNTVVGLEFMENHHIFNVRCPIEISNFLRSREVNLQVLADFLSSRNSVFHLQVLRCFLQNLSLQKLSFLEAFDTFISSFKLPDDSTRINFLIGEFCQYYTKCIQKCTGMDLGALMGLSRVIVLLRSSVTRSKLISSSNSILSFSEFVKNVQSCFKGQHVPYNMEMLQKIYISTTRSNTDNGDLAENLISRIGNIDECQVKSGGTTKTGRTSLSNGYLQQTYRHLTYCCDVQQADLLGKKIKKNEHLRSIFVFNDTVVVAKRHPRTSAKQTKLFRTDSRFQCKAIINLLNYRVEKTTGSSYRVSFCPLKEPSRVETNSDNAFYFLCDSESSREKLLSKINMSQLESLCVERLRLQQWNCAHQNNECLCLSTIGPRLTVVQSRPDGK